MAFYRFYTLSKEGRIAGLPEHIECLDDSHAIAEAKLLANERAIEIWHLTRYVARIEGTTKQ